MAGPTAPSRSSRVVTAALAALLAPRGAHADPPPASPRTEPRAGVVAPEGEVIVTARRAAEWAHHADRSVYVIPPEAIARRQPRSVPELLHDVPGASVQMTNRGAGAPILRGLVGPQNLVLFDGIRINNATWRTGPLQYLALIEPSSVERLEVQLGPGSLLYGSDAMGGVVHALPHAMPRADGLRARAGLRARTADAGLEAFTDVTARRGALGAAVGAAYRSYDALRAGGGAVLPLGGYRSLGGRARVWVALSPSVTVSANYFGAAVLGAGQSHTLAQGSYRVFDNQDHLAYLDVRGVPGGASVLREARAAIVLHVTDERAEQLTCAANDGVVRDRAGCLARDPAALGRRRSLIDTVYTVGAFATSAWGPASGRVRVVAGVDVYHDLVRSSRTSAAPPAFAPGPVERGNFSDGSWYASQGAYAQGELDVLGAPAARERLVLAAGARLARFAARAAGVPGIGDVGYEHVGAVGGASLRYTHARDVTAYASWAQGFRAPNLQETTVLGNTGEVFEVPNAALRPERNDTFEAGLRVRLPYARVGVAGYVSLLSDALVRQGVAMDEWAALGINPMDVGTLRVVRRTNAAYARYVGAEASAAVGPFAGVTAWAHASVVRGAVYDAQRAREPAARVPPPLGAFGVRYERSRWYVEAFARWALAQTELSPSDRSDIRICEDPARPGALQATCAGTPGWITVNVRAGVRVTPGLRLDAMLENLNDARYRYHGSGVDEPGVGAVLAASGEL